MSDKKLVRVIAISVQLQLVVDDGEYLTPISVNPLTIPANRLDDLGSLLHDSLVDLQSQLDESAGVE